MLEDTENWLYEDGEDQPKQVYMDKLQELRVRLSVTFYKNHTCVWRWGCLYMVKVGKAVLMRAVHVRTQV